MQLYALDGSTPVSAQKAEKGKNYICPECHLSLRIRGGLNRQIHFYHLSRPRDCRQHQKSEEHIHMQLQLLRLFGEENCSLEYPFPSLGRIADVAWHAQKIVFEIQCSPISQSEAEMRNADYARAGYQVVWILHDKRFNKNALSAAELLLRFSPCYFTNINKKGQGIVYDQFEVLEKSRRVFKGPPLVVRLEAISSLPKINAENLELPQAILQRLARWNSFFHGDLLHRLLQEGNSLLSAKQMSLIENRRREKITPKRLSLRKLIANVYGKWLESCVKKISQ